MSHSASAAARRLPALLVLGLLALLLWGQCASLLFPDATRHPATLTGWVKDTDSLRTTPATLYLTLRLRNDLPKPVRVRQVSGALLFSGHAYPFLSPAALRDTLVAPWTEITQAVAVPLRLSADSVALLRTALQTSHPADISPQLQWKIRYSDNTYPNARDQGNTSPYLPPLKRQLR